MQKNLISIIVPIYKIEKYISTCIESILNQTYKDIEVILIDDGSPDLCPQICDDYARKDCRIKVIHKENGGLVSARKAGLNIAKGKYIGYVDGDDFIESDFYEVLINSIQDKDIAIANYTRDFCGKLEKMNSTYSAGMFNGVTTYVWNKLFKREYLLDIQNSVSNEITIGEDGAVTYPYLNKYNHIAYVSNFSYHYRQRDDSMLKVYKPFEDDKVGLIALYNHLVKEMPNYKKDIEKYVNALSVIRYGYIGNINTNKLAIYSAGTYGQQVAIRYNPIKWVDDDWEEYRKCGLNVDSVESIKNIEFDNIFIATLDKRIADKATDRLVNLGIKKEKIKWPESIVSIHSLGQAGYIIRSSSGQKLGIDLYMTDCVERLEGNDNFKRLLPKLVDPSKLELDYIIATHPHYDHYDVDAIPQIMANGKTKLFASINCPKEQNETFVKPGDVIKAGDFELHFINCDHGNSAPDAVGVIIKIDNLVICEVGDTCLRLDRIDEYLSCGPIDVLIAPINGAYGNLNEEECVKLANALNPKLTIPCHYGMFKAHGGNIEKFKRLMNLGYKILEQGNIIYI